MQMGIIKLLGIKYHMYNRRYHLHDIVPYDLHILSEMFKVLTPWTGSSIMFMIDPDDQYYVCCPDRLHEALLEILPMCVIIA